ncbi:hypothetical protein LC608_28935 [Nostoc sp. XA010]|uniref:hypothetical protein n=1 Tax=Nostoc sp. XA010 TaxID=2780407 RepID=UPI001E40B522|nr:hypothetical protein [Nostoc sp. XA010]MCC5660926.1 hypothetical protein [Nostoc sp. XA010]
MQGDALALLVDALALSADALALSADALALSADALALSADALALLVDALALSNLIRKWMFPYYSSGENSSIQINLLARKRRYAHRF